MIRFQVNFSIHPPFNFIYIVLSKLNRLSESNWGVQCNLNGFQIYVSQHLQLFVVLLLGSLQFVQGLDVKPEKFRELHGAISGTHSRINIHLCMFNFIT